MRIQATPNISAIAMICVSALATASVSAQELTADSVPERHYELKETTVTGSAPVKKVRAAVPTFKIEGEDAAKLGITDIADALHRLPGVNLRDYGGAGGLKTVSVRGLGASHTTVAYDGLPLSDAQTGAIDLSRYSVDNAGNLQLIIGDNDELFIPVRLAIAPATLTLSTPMPPGDKPWELTTRIKAGSFGYISPFINLSRNLRRGWTVNMTGEFVHVKNNYPFKWVNGTTVTTERRENNRMNSGHIEANLLHTGESGDRFAAKIYYYDNSRQLPGPVLYYNVNGSQEHLREKKAFAQADYSCQLGDKWKLRAAAKFNWAASLYTDYGSRQAGNYLEENYFQREYYLTANLLYRPGRHWTFDYSADYIFNNLNSNLATDARPFRNSILQSLTAKWTLSRITLTGRLIESVYLNGTGVKTAAPSANANRLSPSIAVSARLLNSGLLYGRLSYKNIFRMPTFNEAFFNHFGSPDLKPESTDQFDLGLTFQAPRLDRLPMMTLTADVYRNHVNDRIVAVPYNMFVWTVTNVSRVVATGADITLNATFDLGRRQQLVAGGTWSFQRAKIDVEKENPIYGKQVAYTPRNSGSFSLGYENPWINLVWHGQGMSARYTGNANTPEMRLPGYFEFGATAWRTFKTHGCAFELRLDVLNILNKQYYIIGRYPMPGRAWQASVKFSI